MYLMKEEVVVGVYSMGLIGSGSFIRDLPEEFFLKCFPAVVLG